MPKATYTGRHTAVDVPTLGIDAAANGTPIDVTDAQAAALADMPDWTIAADATKAPAAPEVTETEPDDGTSDDAKAAALEAQAAELEAQAAELHAHDDDTQGN